MQARLYHRDRWSMKLILKNNGLIDQQLFLKKIMFVKYINFIILYI